jgi:hypothetical protein
VKDIILTAFVDHAKKALGEGQAQLSKPDVVRNTVKATPGYVVITPQGDIVVQKAFKDIVDVIRTVLGKDVPGGKPAVSRVVDTLVRQNVFKRVLCNLTGGTLLEYKLPNNVKVDVLEYATHRIAANQLAKQQMRSSLGQLTSKVIRTAKQFIRGSE